jgi:alpha-amylase
MTKLYLSLALHNHQPIGNFDWVFEEGYQKSYLPMLEALERHPTIRLAIHNTGCLLDWLLVAHPEYIERLATLAQRGQVEIMAGAYYEPILVSLPDVDKAGQLDKLVEAVESNFGVKPTGGWLAERIWEPHLPKPLAEAGIEYIIVDDTHLRYAGISDDNMLGYYVTEEQGHPLKVFPSDKFLRFNIPWQSPENIIAGLRQIAEKATQNPVYKNTPPVAIMGDDGEKFGLWPGTYDLCWTNGWIEEFFTAIEANSDWLETIPPGDYAQQFGTLGQVYMTAASYDEMTEWALPAQATATITHLKQELKNAGREDILQFFKGGLWRGFMAKYPEVNQMHKKALAVSKKVHAMPAGEAKETALDHLWSAQCNCGYWHGLFGGIYLFHIRGANYRHLIRAETLADNATLGESGWIHAKINDFDRDGADELLLSNNKQWLCFDLHHGGAMVEWDFRDAPYNLLNTMTRYFEGYHGDLRQAIADGRAYIPGTESESKNVHDRGVMVKEHRLDQKLHYDQFRRAALQDHFLPQDTTLDQLQLSQYVEMGDFVTGQYEVALQNRNDHVVATLSRTGFVKQDDLELPVRVEKVICLAADSGELEVAYTVTNLSETGLACLFAVENNFGLEGGQDPLTYFEGLAGLPGNAGISNNDKPITTLSLISDIITVRSRIDITHSVPAQICHFPFESVTNSEGGYEANYQGTSIFSVWRLNLAPQETNSYKLTFALNNRP